MFRLFNQVLDPLDSHLVDPVRNLREIPRGNPLVSHLVDPLVSQLEGRHHSLQDSQRASPHPNPLVVLRLNPQANLHEDPRPNLQGNHQDNPLFAHPHNLRASPLRNRRFNLRRILLVFPLASPLLLLLHSLPVNLHHSLRVILRVNLPSNLQVNLRACRLFSLLEIPLVNRRSSPLDNHRANRPPSHQENLPGNQQANHPVSRLVNQAVIQPGSLRDSRLDNLLGNQLLNLH